MKLETLKDETLIRYLLDEMTDIERQEIEENFFQDDSFFEEMLALEDELRFEYQQNRLNPGRRAAFEKKFLRTPDDLARNVFAETFLQSASALAGESPEESQKVIVVPGNSWWQSVAAFFDFSASPMRYSLAAATVLLALGVGFLFFQNAQLRRDMAGLENNRTEEIQRQEQILAEKQRQQTELQKQLVAEKQERVQNEQRIQEIETERQRLEREIAETRRKINQAPSSSPPQNPAVSTKQSPPPQSTVMALALSPGLFTRGEGEDAVRLKLSPAIRTFRLNLLLKSEGEYKSFRAVLKTLDDDKEVWSGATSKSRGKGAKRSVSLEIPAKIFKRADYELTLFGQAASGEKEEINTYYFGILK